jgi:uncharacterized protein
MMKGGLVGRTVLPFVLGVLVWSVAIVSVAYGAGLRREKLTIETGTKSYVFDIEVAETDAQQMLGLMYRTSLGRRQGMLFPYKKPKVLTMWMRNTYISLDMVFIKADGTVQRVEEGTEPLSEEIISSGAPVSAVLEIPAGVASEIGLKPGNRVIEKTYFPAKR